MMEYEKLLPYCITDNQLATIEAIIKHGSQRKAAVALGMAKSTIGDIVRRISKRAANNADLPEYGLSNPLAPGFELNGYSVLTKTPSGESIWLKARKQKEIVDDAVSAALRGAAVDISQVVIPKFLEEDLDTDIIPWFNIGDGHLGVIAFDAVTGFDNNIDITKRELLTAMFKLIDESPKTERCVINDLGDMTHYQNMNGISESGHMFDYDKCFPIMIEVYAMVMKAIVMKALNNFKYVDVIINQGNHSRENDFWMATFLRNMFEHTGRLHVLPNENVFIPYRMGNTFIMTHHGDKTTPDKLQGVMSNDYADDWGESTYRYAWTGHTHTMKATEKSGMVWESWNQMNRGDKYAQEHGWRSRKCMTRVDMSKTYGESGRKLIPIEQVMDIVANAKPGTASANKRRAVYTV